MYSGGIPRLRPMVMGHEFMGIVGETGPAVTKFKRREGVVVPFPIACGTCFFCNRQLPAHCVNSNPEHYGSEGGLSTEKAGGIFGYTDLYGGYITAARRNMCAFLMPTSARAGFLKT